MYEVETLLRLVPSLLSLLRRLWFVNYAEISRLADTIEENFDYLIDGTFVTRETHI